MMNFRYRLNKESRQETLLKLINSTFLLSSQRFEVPINAFNRLHVNPRRVPKLCILDVTGSTWWQRNRYSSEPLLSPPFLKRKHLALSFRCPLLPSTSAQTLSPSHILLLGWNLVHSQALVDRVQENSPTQCFSRFSGTEWSSFAVSSGIACYRPCLSAIRL